MQKLYPELNHIKVIELTRGLFPELNHIKVIASVFPDIVQTRLRDSICENDKPEYVAICLSTVFLRCRNQFPPPLHRREFDPLPLAKERMGNRCQKRKIGRTISQKKDVTITTKTEKWAKSHQKLKHNHQYHLINVTTRRKRGCNRREATENTETKWSRANTVK
jgi:hypothetical protein